MIDTLLQQFHADAFMMGLTIYREAAGEPDEGKAAVGHVILTRADHPSWEGDSPYSVITKREQFSSISHLGDPMTVNWPSLEDRTFRKCLDIAQRVLLREIPNPVPFADHYCTAAVAARTKWVDEKKFLKQIGNHRFYRLDGAPAVG